MKIKLNGGSSELHMISLNDIKKLSDGLQKISYNYEFQTLGTKNRDIFIKATKKGSFEISLGMIDPSSFKAIAEGLAAAYLYDLIKKMKNYVKSEDFSRDIKTLVDATFKLAIEIAQDDYYDVRFEKKKQTIENNIKQINAEFSNYNAIKQIVSIIGSSEEKSLKPTSISFTSSKDDREEVFEIGNETREIFEQNKSKTIKVDNIIVSGVPNGLSRSSKSFNMEVSFIGRMKVRVSDGKHLEKVSDYFKSNKSICIEVEPIVKIGELIETREARLVRIVED